MTTATPWHVRGSQAFEVDSESVGDRFAVGVWQSPWPAATKPKLVYVLDGSFALQVAVGVCSLMPADLIRPGFPPVVLVGVDYPEGATNARSRDYTMPGSVPEPMKSALEASPSTTPGGAERFLRFLETELDPLVRERFDVDDGPAGILGDSFGGTFTFYAFTQQSRLFDRYWLGSPGLFTTEKDFLADFQTTLSGRLVHDTRMFLSLGSLEADGPVDFYADLGRSFTRLTSMLEDTQNDRLDYKAQVYPGHTHISVLLPALNDALIYLFGP